LGLVTTDESYSTLDELAALGAAAGSSRLYGASYTRDRLGRVITANDTVMGEASALQYQYDSNGRLISVSSNGTVSASYEYDASGNRTRLTEPSGVLTGAYDARDQLTSYGGTTYLYSLNGELMRAASATDTTSYTYNTFGSLLSARLASGNRIDYVLDAANRRIGKRVNGILVQAFLYQDQLRPVVELDGANNVVSRFVYGTRPAVPDFMIKNNVTYRIISDQAGSVRLVVNTQTGEVAQRLDYDEFGRVVRNTNPGFQPYGFGAGLYDDDTKLLHLGAREYDAFTGRFTREDPVGLASGTNLHIYAGNDPVNFGDPSGLDPCDCSQKLLVGLDGDLSEGVNYTRKRGVHAYFAPDFADRLSIAIRTLNSMGVVPRITDGYRTLAEQRKAAANPASYGVCNPDRKDAVCKHMLGYSVDLHVGSGIDGYNVFVFTREFDDIYDVMRAIGIQWGGDFETPDWVHFYNNPLLSDSQVKASIRSLEDYFNNCLL
jgi:RHS repeat-associated protein